MAGKKKSETLKKHTFIRVLYNLKPYALSLYCSKTYLRIVSEIPTDNCSQRIVISLINQITFVRVPQKLLKYSRRNIAAASQAGFNVLAIKSIFNLL